jgi:hypothetical protein
MTKTRPRARFTNDGRETFDNHNPPKGPRGKSRPQHSEDNINSNPNRHSPRQRTLKSQPHPHPHHNHETKSTSKPRNSPTPFPRDNNNNNNNNNNNELSTPPPPSCRSCATIFRLNESLARHLLELSRKCHQAFDRWAEEMGISFALDPMEWQSEGTTMIIERERRRLSALGCGLGCQHPAGVGQQEQGHVMGGDMKMDQDDQLGQEYAIPQQQEHCLPQQQQQQQQQPSFGIGGMMGGMGWGARWGTDGSGSSRATYASDPRMEYRESHEMGKFCHREYPHSSWCFKSRY